MTKFELYVASPPFVLPYRSCCTCAIVPLFALKNAEFGGSDDAGSQMISEIQGEEYEPWFTPVLESALGGELPGEVESMIFCVQTGIGVGIIAFVLGRYVERRKWQKKEEKNNEKAGETEVSHA